MTSATWPDIIRDRDFATRYKKYHHSNWHYSDTFWTSKDGKFELVPEPEENGKAIEKLVEFDKLIRSNGSDEQKAIAISWLEHLIGDLHQPLHASGRITDLEPKGDQGGNLFLLTPKGTAAISRKIFIGFGILSSFGLSRTPEDDCEGEYINPIARRIMKKYPFAKLQSKLNAGNFEEWKSESLHAAEMDVYSPDLKRFEMPSASYKKKAMKVAEERLALAGYRMGELFNQRIRGRTIEIQGQMLPLQTLEYFRGRLSAGR